MDFPRLQQINFLGKPDEIITTQMISDLRSHIQGLMSVEPMTLNRVYELSMLRRLVTENWTRIDNNLGWQRDHLIDSINQKMTQATALGYEKQPDSQPYKRKSGVFFKITWLFKKLYLYLSKTSFYVKLRTVCRLKSSSK